MDRTTERPKLPLETRRNLPFFRNIAKKMQIVVDRSGTPTYRPAHRKGTGGFAFTFSGRQHRRTPSPPAKIGDDWLSANFCRWVL